MVVFDVKCRAGHLAFLAAIQQIEKKLDLDEGRLNAIFEILPAFIPQENTLKNSAGKQTNNGLKC
jgi:hypothetical protein